MKKKIVLIIIAILIITGVTIFFICDKDEESKIIENSTNKTSIEEKKNDIGATGETEIYEIQKDNNDGREVLTVKPSIKYKVAFAGMINNSKPNINELDNIFEEKSPIKTGIWVDEESRESLLKLITNSKLFESVYTIDEEGYLVISKENQNNENDLKLQKAINSSKQYILSISSKCYIIDDITGEILDYSFENMDQYQTYEYFYDQDRYIIFITENKNNQLSGQEILKSIINLIGE